jgi:modulator of FtsH protease HflC
MKRMAIFLTVVVLMALMLATTVFYQVDYNQVALLRTFGDTTTITKPGPHMKWPWPIQRVIHYDINTHVLEDALNQQKLADDQNVLLTMYCAWRLTNAKEFDTRFESVQRGEEFIRRQLENTTGNLVGKYKMQDLVNTDPKAMRLKNLEDQIVEALRPTLTQAGIELVALGTKSLGVTENVSKAIINAQQSERKRAADAFNTQGQAIAQAIRDRARADSEQIIAFANRKAELIKAEGELWVTKQYPAFQKAPELAMFLRSLDSLKIEMQRKTVVLLDWNNLPALKLFRDGTNGISRVNATTMPASAPAAAAMK